MVFFCCVPGCRNGNKQYQMHTIPKNEDLCRLWLTNIGRLDLLNKPKYRISYRVCHAHFGRESLYVGIRNRSLIRRDAVPTLHLPAISEDSPLNAEHLAGKESVIHQDKSTWWSTRPSVAPVTSTSVPFGVSTPVITKDTMTRWCSVPGCLSRNNTRYVFPNPKLHPKVFDQWLSVIGDEQLVKKDRFKVYTSSRICARHFEDRCFRTDFMGKKRLHRLQVPTLNLPNAPIIDLVPTAITESALPQTANPSDITLEDPLLDGIAPTDIFMDIPNKLSTKLFFNYPEATTTAGTKLSEIVQMTFPTFTLDQLCASVEDIFETPIDVQPEINDNLKSCGVQTTGMCVIASTDPELFDVTLNIPELTDSLPPENQLCRTCLQRFPVSKLFSMNLPILDVPTVWKALEQLTSIETFNNVLPEKICSDCYKCLASALLFRRRVTLHEKAIKKGIILKELVVRRQKFIKKDSLDLSEFLIQNDNGTGKQCDQNHEVKPDSIEQESMDCDSNDEERKEILKELMECRKIEEEAKNGHIRPENSDNKGQIREIWCPFCCVATDSQEIMDLHMQNIHFKRVKKPVFETFLCPICGKLSGASRQAIKSHMYKYHSTNRPLPVKKRIQCDLCPKIFHSTSNLIKHKQLHRGKKPYVCELCPEDSTINSAFKSSHSLRLHIRRVHEEQPNLTCDYCGKPHYYKNVLEEHIRQWHTGERPFVCEICGKAYSSKSTLRSHFGAHTTKELCPVCGKLCAKTRLSKHLKHHYPTNVVRRKWECPYCDKEMFWTSKSKHLRKVHNVAPEVPYYARQSEEDVTETDSATNQQQVLVETTNTTNDEANQETLDLEPLMIDLSETN